jgi:leucine dehydrogenase
MKKNNSRELLFIEEASLSLKAIVAIDSIVLGPANAGAKLFNYKSEAEAITDALDIAYYNSLKAALLRRSLGGGSIVLWADSKAINNEMYFRAVGLFLNRWNGNLFMSKGTGVSYEDLNHVRKESVHLLGLEETLGGHGRISVNRAVGMIHGLKAAAKQKFNVSGLKGLKIVVQGVGELGSVLVKKLIEEQAEIIITDKIYDKIKVIQDQVNNIKIVKPDDIYSESCDIFCSCSQDRVIVFEDAQRMNCKIVTGSSNVIPASPEVIEVWRKKDILYIPGYVINSGDIIQHANELAGFTKEKAEKELVEIYYNTLELIQMSEEQNQDIHLLSVKKAAEYVRQVAAIKMLR